MDLSKMIVTEFKPLWLSVDRIGPFQDKLWTFDFTDAEGAPCNYYIFLSANGLGKTTVLDLMAAMMNMLGRKKPDHYGLDTLDDGPGRAQLDILVSYTVDGKPETVVLSLVCGTIGENTFLKAWGADELSKVHATEWRQFGYRRNKIGFLEQVHSDSSWAAFFNVALRRQRETRLSEFETDPLTYPTVLHFSTYRNIEKISSEERAVIQPEGWGYHPVHFFGRESRRWGRSLDNLLVWLKWLDDGRFEKAVDMINKRVFRDTPKYLEGVRKDPPEAIVRNEGAKHRLDQLSSGEKSLLQICLRMGAHMTQNTILLLDEMDVHLHPNWQHRILNWLKDMAKNYPGLTIIASTHSREIIHAYAHDIREEGLRKGGYIIERDFD